MKKIFKNLVNNKKFSDVFDKALVIVFLAIIFDFLGVAFLVLKTVSIPFVPNRSIDNMSDYYTAIWANIKRNSIDNERFAVIDITENSRSEIAEILATVNKMKPNIIGFDVSTIWNEDNSVDSLYIMTINSIHNIILPVEYHKVEQNNDLFLYPIFHDRLINKKYGVVSFPKNRDVLRTYRPSFHIGNDSYDAFGCLIAKECGANISSISNKSKVLINYTTLKLSDDDVISGNQFLNLNMRDNQFLSSQISNKIILIGSTHLTNDQHLTPLGHNISGVMIHAHIINSLIENKTIKKTPLVLRYLCCFIIAATFLLWYQKHKSTKETRGKIWHVIVKCFFIFCASIILFAVIGTIMFSRFCFYIDFSPYIITLILIYLIKDKTIDFKKLCNR